jgi:hypothetical protein
MEEKDVRFIIRKRLNFRMSGEPGSNGTVIVDKNKLVYDGFDMSGYNNSTYSNLELLARFKDLTNLNCDIENRCGVDHLPLFWKGVGIIVKIEKSGESNVAKEDLSGWSTEDIIFEILKLQNPTLLS